MKKTTCVFRAIVSALLVVAVLSGLCLPAFAEQATIRIEAETGKLYGTAEIAENENASGGQFVRELNVQKGYPNYVVFENILAAPGTYTLRFRYVSGTNGTVRTSINDGDFFQIKFTLNMDNNWEWGPDSAEEVEYSKTITLKGDGTDQILMQNGDPTGFVWLDWIELVPVEITGEPPVVVPTTTTESEATTTTEPEATTTTESEDSATTTSEPDVTTTTSSEEEPGTFPWAVVAVVIGVVVLGGGAVVWAVLKKRSKNT